MRKSILLVMGPTRLSGLILQQLRSADVEVTSVQTIETAQSITGMILFEKVICSYTLVTEGDGLTFLTDLSRGGHTRSTERILLGPVEKQESLQVSARVIGAVFFVEEEDFASTIAALVR